MGAGSSRTTTQTHSSILSLPEDIFRLDHSFPTFRFRIVHLDLTPIDQDLPYRTVRNPKRLGFLDIELAADGRSLKDVSVPKIGVYRGGLG
jgi:hypothetical protein